MVLYILAGRNAYEFIRSNLPGAFPSISTVQSLLEKEEKYCTEGEFRFDVVKKHLNLIGSNFAFCAEDSRAVVPQVSFDMTSNSFVGFSLPLAEGIPVSQYFQTDSALQLERWFSQVDKSSLLNLHVIQPVTRTEQKSSPIILSAYGTNSKYRSFDIIRRWLWIFNEFLLRGIRIIGFSSDADPKYMKAMKLVLGFFSLMPNVMISDREEAFNISIPHNWYWFFLRSRQLFLCLQDPIHVCTKLRNRLLSSTADLCIGNQQVSLTFLTEMISTQSKVKHGLVKSDIYPRDRQNFASCQKISTDDVLSELEFVQGSAATQLYLKMIRSIIVAYIDKSTVLTERIYHAWYSVFICRLWWSWLLIQSEKDSVAVKERSDSQKRDTVRIWIQKSFITKASFESIELNAHTLTYLVLLVEENLLPIESLQIFLFNSQSCEQTFRSARSMSGSFSSIVNFSVCQFLHRAQKLSVLNRIRGENISQSSTTGKLSFRFPNHHKQANKSQLSSAMLMSSSMNRDEIQTIVASAFDDVLELFNQFGVKDLLKKKNLETFRSLNDFVAQRLKETWRTIDNSSLKKTSPDSDSDAEYSDDEIDHSIDSEDFAYGSDHDSTIYDLPTEDHSSFHRMRVVDKKSFQHDENKVKFRKFRIISKISRSFESDRSFKSL